MPIFEYECLKCRNRFEHLTLPSSSAPQCPSCRSEDLEKLISLFAVSSEQSRARALRGAKARARKVGYDKEHEEHKGIHEHIHDEQ